MTREIVAAHPVSPTQFKAIQATRRLIRAERQLNQNPNARFWKVRAIECGIFGRAARPMPTVLLTLANIYFHLTFKCATGRKVALR